MERTDVPTVKERFYAKVALPDENGCMRWMGARLTAGYGSIRVHRRAVNAHRLAYELMVGPIPAGLVIDHLCSVRDCVAPDHLEPVTNAENIRLGRGGEHQASRTECPRGHAYDEANTYMYRGSRFCRACQRAAGAAYRAANREAHLARARAAARRYRARKAAQA